MIHDFFLFFKAPSMAYESSRTRGWIRGAAAGLHHSHGNVGSKLPLWPDSQFLKVIIFIVIIKYWLYSLCYTLYSCSLFYTIGLYFSLFFIFFWGEQKQGSSDFSASAQPLTFITNCSEQFSNSLTIFSSFCWVILQIASIVPTPNPSKQWAFDK